MENIWATCTFNYYYIRYINLYTRFISIYNFQKRSVGYAAGDGCRTMGYRAPHSLSITSSITEGVWGSVGFVVSPWLVSPCAAPSFAVFSVLVSGTKSLADRLWLSVGGTVYFITFATVLPSDSVELVALTVVPRTFNAGSTVCGGVFHFAWGMSAEGSAIRKR